MPRKRNASANGYGVLGWNPRLSGDSPCTYSWGREYYYRLVHSAREMPLPLNPSTGNNEKNSSVSKLTANLSLQGYAIGVY